MVEEVEFEFFFTAGEDNTVSLTIIIGDAQIGGSSVKVDDKPVGSPGAIKKLKLGKGKDLPAKTVEVKTLVADVSDTTDQTSVTYVLDGAEPAKVIARRKVQNNGDGILYRAKLTFEAV